MAHKFQDAISLKDTRDDKILPTYFNATQNGIEVAFAGYETKTGDLAVIWIEHHDGNPRICIWADKTQEDPTHIIELSAAKS